jgi:hypothetical protein
LLNGSEKTQTVEYVLEKLSLQPGKGIKHLNIKANSLPGYRIALNKIADYYDQVNETQVVFHFLIV